MFPKNEALRAKWYDALPMKHANSISPSVCSVHFAKEDFQYQRHDTNATRRRELANSEIQMRRLKADAVPSRYLTGEPFKVEPEDLNESLYKEYVAYARYKGTEEAHLLREEDLADSDLMINSFKVDPEEELIDLADLGDFPG